MMTLPERMRAAATTLLDATRREDPAETHILRIGWSAGRLREKAGQWEKEDGPVAEKSKLLQEPFKAETNRSSNTVVVRDRSGLIVATFPYPRLEHAQDYVVAAELAGEYLHEQEAQVKERLAQAKAETALLDKQVAEFMSVTGVYLRDVGIHLDPGMVRAGLTAANAVAKEQES